jgi:trimethylamine--corrinoid protein Co-methyltransferase
MKGYMENIEILSQKECSLIHDNAIRIISEVGLEVEDEAMTGRLLEFGGSISPNRNSIVTFSPEFIEGFIENSEDTPPPAREFTTLSGGYSLRYLDPETGESDPLTLKTITNCIHLANELDNIDRPHTFIGTPSDVPPKVNPLYSALLAWKYMRPFPQCYTVIISPDLCPFLFEMGEVMVEDKGGRLSDYVGGTVFFISPLRAVKESIKIFLSCWKRGVDSSFGIISSMGGSAPVTFAGALSMAIAESLFRCIIQRAYYGSRRININVPRVLDMKYGLCACCRPERTLMNLAVAQLSRRYKARLGFASISAEAHKPSCEAGILRTFTAIPLVLAGGTILEGAGHLSHDVVLSPVQMVIDNEFYGALKYIRRGFDINEDTLAFETIKEICPGGLFTSEMHTIDHYRTELWEPEVFTRESYETWRQKGSKIDVDYAEEAALEILKKEPVPNIDPGTEGRLMRIIRKAEKETL